MRHGNKINHLGRKTGHRKALLQNMAISVIAHKRIHTTVAKAKELKVFLEPLITKAKDNTTHSRRVVFGYLQNKESIKELFGPIAEKIGDRPGGYLRILKTGFRLGDAADMAYIEFVDFNDVYHIDQSGQDQSGRRRRRRRGGSGSTTGGKVAEKGVAVAEETAKDLKVNKNELKDSAEVARENDIATEDSSSTEADTSAQGSEDSPVPTDTDENKS